MAKTPNFGRKRHTVRVSAGEWERLHNLTNSLNAGRLASRRFCRVSTSKSSAAGKVHISGNLRLELPSQGLGLKIPWPLQVDGDFEVVYLGHGAVDLRVHGLEVGGSLICHAPVSLRADSLEVKHALDWYGAVTSRWLAAGYVLCRRLDAQRLSVRSDLVVWEGAHFSSGQEAVIRAVIRGSLFAFGSPGMPDRVNGVPWWEYRLAVRRGVESMSAFPNGSIVVDGTGTLNVHGSVLAGRLQAPDSLVMVGKRYHVHESTVGPVNVRGEIRCHNLRATRIWTSGQIFATGTVRSEGRISADFIEAKRFMAGVGFEEPSERLIRARAYEGELYAGSFVCTGPGAQPRSEYRSVMVEG